MLHPRLLLDRAHLPALADFGTRMDVVVSRVVRRVGLLLFGEKENSP